MTMLGLMYVAIGGAFGSMCRYALASLIGRLTTADFPIATFAINILGGFLMGVWIAAMAMWLPTKAKDLHLLFAVGVLGGFTTFSAFSLDLFFLIERGEVLQASAYALGSVVMSVAALIGGMWCIRLFAG
jgi:CrcB protein